MYFRKCEHCGCALDPGEGRICTDCKEELDSESCRKIEVGRMVRSTKFKQIEMEDFLNGKSKVM